MRKIVYLIGNRIIDKLDQFSELEDYYYIIRTHWSEGGNLGVLQSDGTDIFLGSYRYSNKTLIELVYYAPGANNTCDDILKQELTITGIDMFYGF